MAFLRVPTWHIVQSRLDSHKPMIPAPSPLLKNISTDLQALTEGYLVQHSVLIRQMFLKPHVFVSPFLSLNPNLAPRISLSRCKASLSPATTFWSD